ncbi:hypothetical protein ACFVKH_06025 [Almyronema epifaneia S1]|uniref:Secreted protein n=1 Tax=Almyronema epifaneia S1 TaxID=2991925 RepID=A0ABW6IDR3_9CYAN
MPARESRSKSNRSISYRVAWLMTFWVDFSMNCHPQSWHLKRCLPLWMRLFLTVLADAQMGQTGMVAEQQRLYFSIITS